MRRLRSMLAGAVALLVVAVVAAAVAAGSEAPLRMSETPPSRA